MWNRTHEAGGAAGAPPPTPSYPTSPTLPPRPAGGHRERLSPFDLIFCRCVGVLAGLDKQMQQDSKGTNIRDKSYHKTDNGSV